MIDLKTLVANHYTLAQEFGNCRKNFGNLRKNLKDQKLDLTVSCSRRNTLLSVESYCTFTQRENEQ